MYYMIERTDVYNGQTSERGQSHCIQMSSPTSTCPGSPGFYPLTIALDAFAFAAPFAGAPVAQFAADSVAVQLPK